jgi:hypothetical protein
VRRLALPSGIEEVLRDSCHRRSKAGRLTYRALTQLWSRHVLTVFGLAPSRHEQATARRMLQGAVRLGLVPGVKTPGLSPIAPSGQQIFLIYDLSLIPCFGIYESPTLSFGINLRLSCLEDGALHSSPNEIRKIGFK